MMAAFLNVRANSRVEDTAEKRAKMPKDNI